MNSSVNREAVQFGAFVDARHTGSSARLQALGFDSIWVGEHVFFHVPFFDGLTTLAAVAAQTSRVRIGSAVLLLALRPAAAVASAAMTLDHLSGGRLTLGVGVGGEYPKEFEACGVPLYERGARTNEAIDVLRMLWTGDEVSFAGRFNQLSEVRLQPAPIQPGGPPIWVAGRSDAAIHRAGMLGDGYLPYLFDPPRYDRSLARVLEVAEAVGREPASIERALFLFTCLGRSHEQALAVAAVTLSATYHQDFEPVLKRYGAIGTREEVADKLTEYVRAGVNHFLFYPGCPWDEVTDQYEQWAELVREFHGQSARPRPGEVMPYKKNPKPSDL